MILCLLKRTFVCTETWCAVNVSQGLIKPPWHQIYPHSASEAVSGKNIVQIANAAPRTTLLENCEFNDLKFPDFRQSWALKAPISFFHKFCLIIKRCRPGLMFFFFFASVVP